VLEHFDVESGILVAHSMGAFLSLVFCLDHQGAAKARVGGLVVVGGTAGAVTRGSMQNRLQIPLLKFELTNRLLRSPPFGRAFARSLFGKRPADAVLETVRLELSEANIEPAVPILEAMIREDRYDRLAEIVMPTLVLCGEKDRTCPRWHSERLASDIPEASSVWLDGVGHMVFYEKPDSIMDAVRALSSLVQERRGSATSLVGHRATAG
jgi:pimeloyl-ACP methyl ester carboxylesterase